MSRFAVLVSLTLSGCIGIPDDAVIEKLTIKAWGGNLSRCQELQIDMLEETVARGNCDNVRTDNAQDIGPAVIDGGVRRTWRIS